MFHKQKSVQSQGSCLCFGVSRLGPEPKLFKLMTAVVTCGSEHPKTEESLTYNSRLILHHGITWIQSCRDDVNLLLNESIFF